MQLGIAAPSKLQARVCCGTACRSRRLHGSCVECRALILIVRSRGRRGQAGSTIRATSGSRVRADRSSPVLRIEYRSVARCCLASAPVAKALDMGALVLSFSSVPGFPA
ncbi:hypothetical protein PHYPSEUDO_005007 [Phytophthora pseudosyringae]|uniref:Uncharacterized protein n=1 Tax=Phytophthora pseudosyringae TaxID=221518 RepID=A0A8T1VM64_9STRA|nr:hypothetical protein PHYPSEUDO_005007 [Phytophthora pseudosyringae]